MMMMMMMMILLHRSKLKIQINSAKFLLIF